MLKTSINTSHYWIDDDMWLEGQEFSGPCLQHYSKALSAINDVVQEEKAKLKDYSDRYNKTVQSLKAYIVNYDANNQPIKYLLTCRAIEESLDGNYLVHDILAALQDILETSQDECAKSSPENATTRKCCYRRSTIYRLSYVEQELEGDIEAGKLEDGIEAGKLEGQDVTTDEVYNKFISVHGVLSAFVKGLTEEVSKVIEEIDRERREILLGVQEIVSKCQLIHTWKLSDSPVETIDEYEVFVSDVQDLTKLQLQKHLDAVFHGAYPSDVGLQSRIIQGLDDFLAEQVRAISDSRVPLLDVECDYNAGGVINTQSEEVVRENKTMSSIERNHRKCVAAIAIVLSMVFLGLLVWGIKSQGIHLDKEQVIIVCAVSIGIPIFVCGAFAMFALIGRKSVKQNVIAGENLDSGQIVDNDCLDKCTISVTGWQNFVSDGKSSISI